MKINESLRSWSRGVPLESKSKFRIRFTIVTPKENLNFNSRLQVPAVKLPLEVFVLIVILDINSSHFHLFPNTFILAKYVCARARLLRNLILIIVLSIIR